MFSLPKNQQGQGSKTIVIPCDVPQLGLQYPHEIVFCDNKRTVEKHIKREPTSLSDFAEDSLSSVVDPQNGGNYSILDGEVHGLADMEHDNLHCAKAGYVSERENITSYRHHSSLGKEYQNLSIAVKEESFSDEEVVDVYPAGVEMARTGNEPQSIGMHSNYNMVSCMDANGTASERQVAFDDEEDCLVSFGKASDGVFAGEVGAEIVENRFIKMRGSHKYIMPYLFAVGCDQVGRGCDTTDTECVVEKDGAIDEECVVLEGAKESDYIYVVEAPGHGSEIGSTEGASVSKGIDVENNLKHIVSNKLILDRASRIGNRNLPLADIHTADAHNATQYLYCEVDASECEGGKSDDSMYEPSSDESDFDGNTVSYDSKKECCYSKKNCSANAKRIKKRLPNDWKVERNRCKVCCCFFPAKPDQSIHSCVASNVSCKTCGKRLKNFDALQRHEKVHLDMRPYSCEICGKRYVVIDCFYSISL